jgi:hypothetical protein
MRNDHIIVRYSELERWWCESDGGLGVSLLPEPGKKLFFPNHHSQPLPIPLVIPHKNAPVYRPHTIPPPERITISRASVGVGVWNMGITGY